MEKVFLILILFGSIYSTAYAEIKSNYFPKLFFWYPDAIPHPHPPPECEPDDPCEPTLAERDKEWT